MNAQVPYYLFFKIYISTIYQSKTELPKESAYHLINYMIGKHNYRFHTKVNFTKRKNKASLNAMKMPHALDC